MSGSGIFLFPSLCVTEKFNVSERARDVESYTLRFENGLATD